MNTGNSSDTSPVPFIYAFAVSSLSFNLHFTREWYIIYMQDCPQTAAPCNIVGILKNISIMELLKAVLCSRWCFIVGWENCIQKSENDVRLQVITKRQESHELVCGSCQMTVVYRS